MGYRFSDLPRRHVSLIQTTLDRWVTGTRIEQQPCHIERLPPELLMEILTYTPFYTKCTRRHRDPLLLPDWEDIADDYSEFAPVNTLSDCPAERLVQHGCSIYCPTRLEQWNWPEVTRVCKTWRATCLACAEFWTRLPPHGHDAVERALKLSYGLPLFESCSPRPGHLPAFLTALRSSTRFRELAIAHESVGYYRRDYTTVAQYLTTTSAPMLRSFYFISPYISIDLVAPLSAEPVPKLQHLHLAEVRLSGGRHLFAPSLVHLHLEGCSGAWSDARDMLATLNSMPALQTLKVLGDKTIPSDVRRLDATLAAAFPALQDLQLQADFRRVAGFLGHVVFPTSASLYVIIEHAGPLNDCSNAAQSFAATFRKHYNADAIGLASFSTAKFFVDYNAVKDEDYCMFQFDLGWGSEGRTDPLLPSRVTIRHLWDANARKGTTMLRDIEQIFCSLVPALPCHDARTLHIVQLGDPPLSRRKDGTLARSRVDFWFAGLRHLAKVRTLVIESDPNEILVWLESPANRRALPFPEVDVLKFRHCSMDACVFRDSARHAPNLRLGLPASRNHLAPHLALETSVADTLKSHLALRASTFGAELALHFTSFYDSGYMMHELFTGTPGVSDIQEVENEEDIDDDNDDNEPPKWFE